MNVIIERRKRRDCRCGFCHDAIVSCAHCRKYLVTKPDADAIREAFPDHECEDTE